MLYRALHASLGLALLCCGALASVAVQAGVNGHDRPLRVACVGDSITEGTANADHARNSWPKVLGRMMEAELPGQYATGNFGRSGATMLREGRRPYWVQDVYEASREFGPALVIINLGTNDAVNANWLEHGEEFEQDYRDLIEVYRALEPQPKLWLSNLTPMYAPHPRVEECAPHREVIEATIRELASEYGLDVIDFKSPTSNRPELFPDGLHPNTAGNELMAMAAFEVITGRDAPRDESLRPREVQGERHELVKEGDAALVRPGGTWSQGEGYIEVSATKGELLAGVSLDGGDFHLRARLRMLDQKNSAACFKLDGNAFGFEGNRGTVFRNGPQMGGLRLLHPAGLLWERDAWIEFEVIRNGEQVWFLVDGFVVDMATIPGPIARLAFEPMRSRLQISDWSVVGGVQVTPQEHMLRRTKRTPWIDFLHGGQATGSEDCFVPNLGLRDFDPLPSPDGAELMRIERLYLVDGRSMASLSHDGGESWSKTFHLPASLTGIGHSAQYAPDGSLVITFLDRHPTSPTCGDFVAWVGSYEQLVGQEEGEFTCRLASPVEGVLGFNDSGLMLAEGGVLAWRFRIGTSSVFGQFSMEQLRELLPTRGYDLPIVDLDSDEGRHAVVDREPGQYLGHVTTELLEDGETILAVYPKGHGRGPVVYKRSSDGGQTWSERLPTPESWATSREVPTLHRVFDPKTGAKRLIMWSGLHPARLAVSEDEGESWSELEPVGDWGGIVVMGFVERLKDGSYVAMFHDDGRFFTGGGQSGPRLFTLYKTFSYDGGLTWSFPEVVWSGSDVHLCEPGCVRSPDGETLAVLLRENSRTRNSYVIFSKDEGQTWSAPRELPASLTGDRHTTSYAPDGRLVISFRDMALESPTRGDWVAWVGSWEDLLHGKPGQYRVRIKDNKNRWDSTYPGVEVLADGTFVMTTYGHWEEGEQPYILSTRFTLEELDARAEELPAKSTLFERGMKGVHTYRIPALVTSNEGTLIAACDARHTSGRDLPNDISTVMRRSSDGGRSWSEIETIIDWPAGEGAADPCMLVDRDTGRIWCAVTWSKDVGWYDSKPGYGEDSFHLLLVHSDDDGLSWSEPMDVTEGVKLSSWRSAWFSPGAGVQTATGRLILPFSAADADKAAFSYAAVSDDHGASWKRVGPIGSKTNESMQAQLADGTLICNMRSTHGLKQRAISLSHDDGESWSRLEHHGVLIEPVCQASVLTVPAELTPDGREWLVFCNPASTKRERLTLRVSFDGGESWPVERVVHPGATAYSCMSLLPEGGIGLLYERGESNAYEGISFARIPLQWLLTGRTR